MALQQWVYHEPRSVHCHADKHCDPTDCLLSFISCDQIYCSFKIIQIIKKTTKTSGLRTNHKKIIQMTDETSNFWYSHMRNIKPGLGFKRYKITPLKYYY